MTRTAVTVWQLVHDLHPDVPLDRMFEHMQREQVVQMKVEAVSLDSTTVKVHPDGTGAPKETARNRSESSDTAGLQRFIWLLQTLARQ